MTQTIQKLQKKIMRRIYYAYAVRVGTHPILWNAVLLVVSLYVFVSLVSVSSILHNLLNVKVGGVSQYILNAFMHAQILTLISIGIIFFTLISLRWNIRTLRVSHVQTI